MARAARDSATRAAPLSPHLELEASLRRLPKDMGLVLLAIGTVGLVVPGPVPPGMTFVVLGVVFLRPGLVGRLGRKLPALLRVLDGFTRRYRRDVERRYPGTVRR